MHGTAIPWGQVAVVQGVLLLLVLGETNIHARVDVAVESRCNAERMIQICVWWQGAQRGYCQVDGTLAGLLTQLTKTAWDSGSNTVH